MACILGIICIPCIPGIICILCISCIPCIPITAVAKQSRSGQIENHEAAFIIVAIRFFQSTKAFSRSSEHAQLKRIFLIHNKLLTG